MNPLIIGIIALIALAAVAMIIIGQRRTRRLSEQFGPEYERTLQAMRDRGKAESELRLRAERVDQLPIRVSRPSARCGQISHGTRHRGARCSRRSEHRGSADRDGALPGAVPGSPGG